MKKITWTVLGWLLLSITAQAASFDCAKAATKVEHLICVNPEISKLDEELNAAYKAAMQDGEQAEATKQTQKQWMKERDGCSDAGCVKRVYENRLKALGANEQSAEAGKARAIAESSKEDATDNPRNNQQYHFQLTKGKGVPVCDAYLERLNTTEYVKPPYCDRTENDAVKGFARLNRVPLSPNDVHDLYPIVNTFMSLANQKNLDWTGMNLQQQLTQTGQFRLSESEAKYLQMALDGGWAKMWRYDPPIDIDNDGVRDNVEVWHGSLVRGVGGIQCGGDWSDKFPGETSFRQPQIAFVITGGNDRLDVSKTVRIFGHPSGGFRLSDGSFSNDFRPVGRFIGIFKYQNIYYFDTFFDGWGDFENKRQKDKNIVNTLAVFLHKDGKTRQVCEYLMTDNETQNQRRTK